MNESLLSSKKLDWCTPADFFKELDREFHFDLDPAATEKSAKCARYFTPDDDGLQADWGGCCVFCNPPYGRQISEWVRKGYEESRKQGTVVVMLIPARTDTSYFHDYILHGKAAEIRFLRGRLKFTDEDGNAKDSAPFPSAVVVWRSPDMGQNLRGTGVQRDRALCNRLDGNGGHMNELAAIRDGCLRYELTIISIADELTEKRISAYKSGKTESFKAIISLLECIKQEAKTYKEYLDELN